MGGGGGAFTNVHRTLCETGSRADLPVLSEQKYCQIWRKHFYYAGFDSQLTSRLYIPEDKNSSNILRCSSAVGAYLLIELSVALMQHICMCGEHWLKQTCICIGSTFWTQRPCYTHGSLPLAERTPTTIMRNFIRGWIPLTRDGVNNMRNSRT
jgi:hypothetical protein